MKVAIIYIISDNSGNILDKKQTTQIVRLNVTNMFLSIFSKGIYAQMKKLFNQKMMKAFEKLRKSLRLFILCKVPKFGF